VRRLRQLGEESREGRLARNQTREVDSASPSDEGIVVEDANEVGDRRKPQVVVGHVAPPEDLRVMSFGAASPWASELFKEFFIGKRIPS